MCIFTEFDCCKMILFPFVKVQVGGDTGFSLCGG